MANNLSAFNAQAWSKRLITRLDQINVMLPLVNRDWEGELQNVGDTVQVRTPGNITMGSYGRGGSINYQDLQPLKEPMTVSDAEYFAFQVDDLDRAQSDLSAMDIYMKRAAVALNNTIEKKLLAQTALVHADNQITGASGAAIAITGANVYGLLVQARSALSRKNVPLEGRWAIVDPDTTSQLLQSPQFIRATDLGDRVVEEGSLNGQVNRPGFIGRCAGFDVYESNQVYTDGTAKYPVFGDRDFISYAAQLKEMEILRLQVTFADAVRGLLLHDAHVFSECSKRGACIKAAM